MILAAGPAVALDPTAQVLLTIFGAALVTALAGFAGGWLQSRRDHQRWVRQERLAAYLDFLKIAQEFIAFRSAIETTSAEHEVSMQALERLVDEIPSAQDEAALHALGKEIEADKAKFDAQQTLLLDSQARGKALIPQVTERGTATLFVGPIRVEKAAIAFTEALGSDLAELTVRLAALRIEMSKALGMTD